MTHFLVSFAFWCSWPIWTSEKIGLEEMGAKEVVSVATHDNRSLVITTTGGPQFHYHLFDLLDQSITHIEDGRINGNDIYIATTTQKGFALVGLFWLKVFYLSSDGSFRSAGSIKEFTGFGRDIQSINACPTDQGRLWLSFQFYEEPDLYLAEIDIEARTFEIIHTEPNLSGDNKVFWYQKDGDNYRVTEETGAIDLLNPKTFKKKESVRGARQRLENPHYRKFGTAYDRRSKYFSILATPLRIPIGMKLGIYRHPEKQLVLLTKEGLQEGPNQPFPISKVQTTELWFDPEEGTFHFK